MPWLLWWDILWVFTLLVYLHICTQRQRFLLHCHWDGWQKWRKKKRLACLRLVQCSRLAHTTASNGFMKNRCIISRSFCATNLYHLIEVSRARATPRDWMDKVVGCAWPRETFIDFVNSKLGDCVRQLMHYARDTCLCLFQLVNECTIHAFIRIKPISYSSSNKIERKKNSIKLLIHDFSILFFLGKFRHTIDQWGSRIDPSISLLFFFITFKSI